MLRRNADASTRGKVLILGEDSRIILPILRSLGRRGLEVHVGWCPTDTAALHSRYLHRRHELAWYSAQDSRWLDDLSRLLDAETFDLVIPATEAAVFPLHGCREHFDGRIYLPPARSVDVAFDKIETWRCAVQLGIPTPRGVVIEDAARLDIQTAGLTAPVAVKPCRSVRSDQVLLKHYVLVTDDLSAARRYAGELLAGGSRVLIQDIAPGQGVGVELLMDRGEVLFAFQHRRLHETSGFGSTYRVSVPLDPELLAASAALMKALEYTGVAMVEYRVDPATGRWILLEINARFWGSLPLAMAAGADFPRYLFELLVEGRRTFPREYRLGVRCRNLLNDCRWMWRSLRGASSGTAASAAYDAGWGMNVISRGQWLKDALRLVSGWDHEDSFDWADPAPAWEERRKLARWAIARR